MAQCTTCSASHHEGPGTKGFEGGSKEEARRGLEGYSSVCPLRPLLLDDDHAESERRADKWRNVPLAQLPITKDQGQRGSKEVRRRRLEGGSKGTVLSVPFVPFYSTMTTQNPSAAQTNGAMYHLLSFPSRRTRDKGVRRRFEGGGSKGARRVQFCLSPSSPSTRR